jgi:choline-sulfatase
MRASRSASRHLALRLSAFGLVVCGLASCSGEPPEARPPQRSSDEHVAESSAPEPPRLIVLISLDTLRPDHLGFYGYPKFTSPVLDTLALEGVVFDDATSTAAWTLPSHASMLTGLFPKTHGVQSSRTKLPAQVPTLASILGDAGWDTGAVVNIEWLRKETYEITRDFARYAWAPSTLNRRSPSSWVTDQTIDWIDAVGDGRLFVFAHYYDLHTDYTSELAYEKLFLTPYDGIVDGTGWQLKQASVPQEYLDSCHSDFDADRCSFGEDFVLDESVKSLRFSADDVRRLEELYDSQIRQLDTELSRLFAALRTRGLLDESLLIVTSDHGEEFMEHGSVEHSIAAYQESVRVPLLIRGPGIPRGLRIPTPVSLVDVVPTILAQTGVEAPSAIEGLDLSPLWQRAEGAAVPSAAFANRLLFVEAAGGISHNYFAGDFFPIYRAVRRGDYKLIIESRSNTSRLYDLSQDPLEQRDISQQQPEIHAQLLSAAGERYSTTGVVPDADRVELDPEDLKRLRALGYVP